MLIADSRATCVILAGSGDGRSRCTVDIIDVNGRTALTNISRVSVATVIRFENVRHSPILCQSSATHEPITAVASHSRSVSSAAGMPNNCHGANGLKKIPNDRTCQLRLTDPGHLVCAPRS